MMRILGLLFMCSINLLSAHAAHLATPSARGEVVMHSWKELRDAHVVKQDRDYSCGAASLATLLNEFYGLSLTEEQILKDMNKPDMMANFDDMARVVIRYGFNSGGVALSYEQLSKLIVPVVVYLQHRGEDHFSVLRGISATQVQLADPSWGNRIFSKAQFLAMWETREDEKLKGKILLVLPQKADVFMRHPEFFAPPASSSLAIEILTGRRNW